MTHRKHRQGNSAGQPTISIQAERTAESLTNERTQLMRRRLLMIGVPALAVILLVSGLLFSRGAQPASSSSIVGAVATAVPTPIPQAQAGLVVAPTVQSAVAPVAQSNPPAAPVLPTTLPATNPQSSSGLVCPTIAGLPLYNGVTCVKHASDEEDGVTKNKNTYVTNAGLDDVRRFYEGAFTQNSWTIKEMKHDVKDNTWSYEINQAPRQMKIEIEPTQDVNGVLTQITVAEK